MNLISTWYVNLDRRLDKSLVMRACLNGLGWPLKDIYRFSGHDGMSYDSIEELCDAAIEDGFDHFDKLRRAETRGRLGCLWSWCSVTRELCGLRKNEAVLLLVDDCIPRKRRSILRNLVREVPDLKIVQLMNHYSEDERSKLEKYSDELFYNFCGASDVGLILSSSGAELLLGWLCDIVYHYPSTILKRRSVEENVGCYSSVEPNDWIGYINDDVFDSGPDRVLV